MCTGLEIPLLATSVGLSTAGTLLSNKESKDNANAVANARNLALSNNLKKQSAYSDENASNLAPAIANYDPTTQATALKTAQSKRISDATSTLKAPDTAEVDSIPLLEGGSGTTKSQIAARMLDSFNKSSKLAKARANFAGYGDVAADNNVALGDASRRIDTVNDFAKNQASLLNSEMDLAGTSAQKTSSGLGSVLSGLGQLGSMYAGSGKASGKASS